MSRAILITRGQQGARLLWPGTLVDDAYDPGITQALTAQGTRLGDASSGTLVTAATIASNLKRRAAPIEQAEQVMQAAADAVASETAGEPGPQGEQGETGPQGPQGEPGADGAVGGTAVVGAAEAVFGLGPSGTDLIGITSGTATPTVIDSETAQSGMRSPQMVCSSSWPVNAHFLVEGTGRAGAAQSEVVTSPGLSGGTVKAVKSYLGGFTITVQNPSGIIVGKIQLSQRVGVMNVPVVEFVAVFDQNAASNVGFVQVDKANGWYDVGVLTSAPTHFASYTHRITVA